MMATLATVLARFEVRVAEGMGSWDDISDRLVMKFTLATKGGIHLHFIPRTEA